MSDTKRIAEIERDNKKLQTDQKKAEWKLVKQLNQKGERIFADDQINHIEI